MKRTILHCDLNCFFASVEMLYHPEFRDVPMAIGGDQAKRHGIILAKNVPAKRKGIITAESINEAKRKCPELIVRDADYDSYIYFSKLVRDLYYEYTDQIEPFGIDECWLDITESLKLFGGRETIVRQLLNRVKTEIGLTLSIGVSFNKIYAKLGSDLASENDFCIIDSLDPIRDLGVGKLLGVGESCQKKLLSYGILTIGDLASSSPVFLSGIMGKYGPVLHEYANGIGHDTVKKIDEEEEEEVKSISCVRTASKDLCNTDEAMIVLRVISDELAAKLRKKKLFFHTIALIIRDEQLKTHSFQKKLMENSDLGKDIYSEALKLFIANVKGTICHSIGIAVSDLSERKDNRQISFFNENGYSLRQKKQEEAIDIIRSRFGKESIAPLRAFEDKELSGFHNKNLNIDLSERISQ